MAYTTAKVHKTPYKFSYDWVGGAWEGVKHEFLGKSNLTKEYIKAGGGFGFTGELRQPKGTLFKKSVPQKGLTIIKSPFKLIEKISATVELAPRIGTFKRAKKTGYAPKDAVLIARQSTIDFSRGGVYTKVVNQFVPFLNARVQGRVTLAQALKNNPKATLAKTFAGVVAPAAGLYAWNRYYFSDLYDDIPEYIKQNYFTILYDTDKDKKGRTVPKYFTISKGDVGQMAWNPIEFALDKIQEKNPEAIQEFAINYLSDVSPVEFARKGKVSLSKMAGSLIPPIAKGFAEDWANLKFYTGTEIVPYYMGKTKPPELQYKENTPQSYQWLGKKLGVSPLRLQNFASNIVAGYGREGLDPSAMLRGLTGRVVKTRGGAFEQRAWIVIKDIEQGYVYTRAYAEEMIKNGDVKGGLKLLNEWNRGLNDKVEEYNKQFSKHGLKDKGGLKKSYQFTPKKKRYLLRSQARRNRIPIQRRLRAR